MEWRGRLSYITSFRSPHNWLRRLMENSFKKIFFLGLPAGVLTCFAFIVGYFEEKNFVRFFSSLITMTSWDIACHNIISFIFLILLGTFFAALLSPWAYFCLRDKNLIIILPLLYVSVPIVALFLSNKFYKLYGPCGAWIPAIFFICLFWILILLLCKYLAPKKRRQV